MLIKNRMSQPVITVDPDMPIMDALNLMKTHSIRRTPVIDQQGKLIGIVSDKDLLNAGPSDATSLSVWEINYLIGKIKVKQVMTRAVLTVEGETPIEEAARIMVDNKVGGLPVMNGDEIIGVITESDLFKILLELMGARETAVRLTAVVPDVLGELDKLTHAIAEAGGSFISFGQFNGDDDDNRIVTFKVSGLDETQTRQLIEPLVEKIIDLRTI
ncbi:MAG: CBS domain-containing protein [Anaerolineales bacterium]|nr:CBS domain-containing protein [Anaerolineales bacterium]